MRVLLATYGTRGDVEPMVALAVRLREAGVQVRLCAPPDEETATLADRAGVALVPFSRSWQSWEGTWTPAGMAALVPEFIETLYGPIAAAAPGCDLLVASGMMHFVSGTVAEKTGIPRRFVLFSTSILDGPRRDAVVGAPINAHRESLGLPPVTAVREYLFTRRPWIAEDPTLAPWADVDVVRTGAWLLPDARALPAELMAFLDAGPPPVYLGFGSMAMHAAREAGTDLARETITSIRAQGRRAIVARGWAELGLIDDRDDCFAIGEVNHQALFTRVAAVIHHGGAGTTTKAAQAGTPQVVVPQAADQHYWASRVAELGIGAAHDGPTPTAGSLNAALTTALDPRTRSRATAVAGMIRTDGATVAAELVLDVISRESPAVPA